MAAVTARGVVDGEPAALEGLCAARGRAVLAYCERLCGPVAALGATIEAFAAFRAAAVADPDPLAIDPEALLLSRTRLAAAACVNGPARRHASICPEVPQLLAGAANGTLEPRDRERLRRHLARCVECRERQRDQQAAERAYRRPGNEPLTDRERAVIVAALTAAAPVGRHPPIPLPQALDGDHDALEQAHETQPPAVAAELDPPQPPAVPAEVDAPPPPLPPVEPPAEIETFQEPDTAVLSAADLTVAADQLMAREAELRQMRRGPERRGFFRRRESQAPRPTVVSDRRDRGHRHHGGLGARVLAPTLVLLCAVLVALGVAGVFSSGGSHPTSSPLAPSTVASTPTVSAQPAASPKPKHRRRSKRPTATTVTAPPVTPVTPVVAATPSPSATATPTPQRTSLTAREGASATQAPAPTATQTTGGFQAN